MESLLIEEFFFFAFIYLFCFLGALSKDLLDTFLEKTNEVLITKIIISSFSVSILVYGASDKLLTSFSYKPFTALCYTMGLVSFEILVKYSEVKEIGDFLTDIYKIKEGKNKG